MNSPIYGEGELIGHTSDGGEVYRFTTPKGMAPNYNANGRQIGVCPTIIIYLEEAEIKE